MSKGQYKYGTRLKSFIAEYKHVGQLRSEAEPGKDTSIRTSGSGQQPQQLPPKLYAVLRAALAWHRWNSPPAELNHPDKAAQARVDLRRAVRAYVGSSPRHNGSQPVAYDRLYKELGFQSGQTPPSCKTR